MFCIVFLSACVTINIGEQSDPSTLPVIGSVSQVDDSSQEDTSSDANSQGESDASSNVNASSDESDFISSGNESVSGEEGSDTSDDYVAYKYDIDISPYLQYISPENPEKYLLLVNYDHRLTSKYVPENLVSVTYSRYGKDAMLDKTCEMALQAFLNEGKLHGVKDVTVTSAYRSYASQDWWFNYYMGQHQSKFATKEECEAYVMTFSCKAGTSEHQTGLALDMHNLASADQAFADTDEYVWLSENAHKFGFVLRFPEGKEDITGIMFEPWHYRFVGREAATFMYMNNLCLEEYYELLHGEYSGDRKIGIG